MEGRQLKSIKTYPKRILIVGFNSRPLVLSAIKIGFDVIAVDYWGDQDLKNKIKNLIVIKEGKEKKDLDKAELLVFAAKDAYNQFTDIEGILIGSGLDDRFDLWEKLNNLAPIFGNNPLIIKKVRDILHLFNEAKKKNISCPYTRLVSTLTEAEEVSKEIKFPIVLKPFSGAGGVNIRIASNQGELKSNLLEITQVTKDKRVYLQEFIKGQDVSSMVLSAGKKSRVLSVNKQLIGLKEVNSPSPFSYCGNIVPLDATEEANQNIIDSSLKLADIFALRGINGIDFVLKDGIPYLMEINPRFPGTFELVENILKTNLIKLHMDACLNKLSAKTFPYLKYGAKYVVFSDSHYILPNLLEIKNICDIPFPGTIAHKGSPICTVQTYGDTKEDAMKAGLKTVNKIYSECKK